MRWIRLASPCIATSSPPRSIPCQRNDLLEGLSIAHDIVSLARNTAHGTVHTIEDVMRTKKEEVKKPQKRIVKAREDEEDEGTDDEGGSEVEEIEAEDLATRRSTRARKPTRFFDD